MRVTRAEPSAVRVRTRSLVALVVALLALALGLAGAAPVRAAPVADPVHAAEGSATEAPAGAVEPRDGPSLAWAAPAGATADPDDGDGDEGATAPAVPPASGPVAGPSTTEEGPETAAAATAPRRLTLGPVSSSRAISAPASDPMWNMQRDGVLGVALSDGHHLWLFADSALVIDGEWKWFSDHGTGAISVGADPFVLTEPTVTAGPYTTPASELVVGDQFSCPAGYGKLAWPSSAVAVPTREGGDAVYVYYQSMCGKAGDPGSYHNVAMGLARYDYDPASPPSAARPIRATVVASNLFPPMPGHGGPGGAGYGTTSAYADGWVYAYGCRYEPIWQVCRVARVEAAWIATASSYRYWDGTTWVADPGAAADVDMPNGIIGVKGSLSYVPALGLYAFADNDFPNPTVAVRWATRPQGPWTRPSFVTLPGCAGTDCWAAEVNGALSTASTLSISYYADGLRPGSRAISVPIVHEPVGAIEMVASGAPNRMVVWGWAVDPDVVDPVTVRLQLDGVVVDQLVADQARPDLAADYPGQVGGGFVRGVDVTPGRHTLCVVGVNRGAGASTRTIGCRDLDVVAPRYGPVLATNDDGRLEVFAMDAAGQLVHAWQLTPGGAWSEWAGTGLDARSAPAIARNGDGRLEVFAVDAGGWLVHRWQVVGTGWSPWVGLGVQASGTPAVATNADGRLELFVASPQGRLLHGWQAPPVGWSPIADAGASARFAPVLAASADGRLEAFVTSADGGVLHAWQSRVNGPFTAWRYAGLIATSAPAAAASVDGRLELFAKDDRGVLVHRWQIVRSGAWTSWQPLAAGGVGSPVATRNGDGRLEVFQLDGLLRPTHAWQDPRSGSGWSGVELVHPTEVPLWTEPAVRLDAAGRLVVVVVTGAGQLRQAQQVPGAGWSAWRPVTPGLP